MTMVKGRIMLQTVISKSQFKPQALKYLRMVEKKKQPITITHQGKPVVRIVPYTQSAKTVLRELRGSVISYKDPTEPVGLDLWEALK